MKPSRGPGRPRSEDSRRAIHEAALRLVARVRYGAITMDALAAEAGVGKQTLYRWWSSRADVMLEVARTLASEHVVVPDGGSLGKDLTRFVAATFGLLETQSPALAALLRGLMAEAQLDPAFLQRLRTGLLEERRAALRELFVRAKGRGELRPRWDIELGVDLVFGVLWYRLLVAGAPFDRAAARELADAVTRAATAA